MRNSYLRLRQVCVASMELEPAVEILTRIFEQAPCHTSELSEYGLQNALFAMGGSFLEIVAPTRPDTAVERFIKRTGGTGGYMAIFDCEDVSNRKEIAKSLDITPIVDQSRPNADLLQLDPKATGLTMLEFDHHQNGEDRLGHYEWAGEGWQSALNEDVDFSGISVTSDELPKRQQQWHSLFRTERNALMINGLIQLDHGYIQFEPSSPHGKPGFHTLHLMSKNAETYLERAAHLGLSVQDGAFDFCGIRLKFS